MIERYEIERNEEWRGWIESIPYLQFPPEWEVKVIPPFGGAMVRFLVKSEGHTVSVYLDCHAALGAVDTPYWEVCPYDDDVWRCGMKDTNELMGAIRHSIESNNEIGGCEPSSNE